MKRWRQSTSLWELKVTRINNETCLYTNETHATATQEMPEFLKEHGTNLAGAAAAGLTTSDMHNYEISLPKTVSFNKKGFSLLQENPF